MSPTPTPSAGELFEPTIWYGIDPSGTVTINIIRAEMGQHVGTSLGRIVAEELEADWNKVKIVTVDSDSKWGTMITGGSWSVWQSFPLLSRAGAAGRIALVEEGAKLLGVSSQMCTAREGAVHAGGRSILYGDIAARGDLRRTFTSEQLKNIPIKAPDNRRLIGRDTMALDVPSKVNGQGRYAAEGLPQSHRPGHQRGHGRQRLPLHDLPANPQSHQARGRQNARGSDSWLVCLLTDFDRATSRRAAAS